MKCFGVASTQSHCTDIFRIKRLPADGYLRFLRVILAVRRRNKRTQNGRSVLTVPFLALGEVHLKAVEAREVPCGAGKRHPHFLVNSPYVPVHPEALAIHRANRLERVVKVVASSFEMPVLVLAADRERDRTGR